MSEQELLERIRGLERQLAELRGLAGIQNQPGLTTAHQDTLMKGKLTVEGNLAVNAMTKNGTGLVTNLNADLLDGLHASQINADQVDGYHAPTATIFTPTWGVLSGTAPNLGNGTLQGRYNRFGNLVHVQVSLSMGSTTTYGTGSWTFALPIAPASQVAVGAAYLVDQGAGYYRATVICGAGSTSALVLTEAGLMQNNIPFIWANTDVLAFSMNYFV